MKKEKSCGCVIIKESKVLLIYEKNQNFWGFPKGHVEKDEDEIATAKRETLEEVGLIVEIDPTKRYEFKYNVGKNIEKTCVLFLATPKTDNIKNQVSEIEKSGWYSFDEALNILPYKDQKEALNQFIKNKKVH